MKGDIIKYTRYSIKYINSLTKINAIEQETLRATGAVSYAQANQEINIYRYFEICKIIEKFAYNKIKELRG